tara:strand:- start:119 stop:1636 length:1518 start_codon:yes stop_codon:yes gene_type:complete
MAVETTFDNEGIKKGLQQITLQLNESNRLLIEQGKPNLLKAFKENQAEVLTNILQHRETMAHAKTDLDYQRKTSKGIKDFGITAKGISYDEEGNLRKPSLTDTIYGQIVELLNAFKGYSEEDIKVSTDVMYAHNKENEENLKNEKDKLKTMKDARDEASAERMVNQGFFSSLLKSANTSGKTNLNILQGIDKIKSLPERLKNINTTLKVTSFDAKKNLRGVLGSGLGNLYNYFAKSDEDKDDKDESRFKKLGKGLLSIGKVVKDTFMKYLGNPFMLLIKGIGLALLTAGIFKFFASPAWQKMKPNIAQSIGDGLEVMDKLLDKLIEAVPMVINGLVALGEGLFELIKYIGDFVPGIEVGKNIRADKIEAARADAKNKDMTDKQIEAQVDAEIAKIRMQHMKTNASLLDLDVMSGLRSQKSADAELKHIMDEFDVNTYGGLQVGDKVVKLGSGKEDMLHLSEIVKSNAGNYNAAVSSNNIDASTTIQRYYTNFKHDNFTSNLSTQP